MRDLLRTYYNVSDKIEIKENQDTSSFVYHDKKYILMPYFRSEEELQDLIALNQELLFKNIPTAKFIQNREKSYLTVLDGKKYVLLEFPLEENKEYDVIDMINFANRLSVQSKKSVLYRNDWADLWSSKIDYFEYQVSQLGKDKPIILNSFSYFVGLAENAIAYVNATTKKYQIGISEKITLQRKRIFYPNIQLSYFNPLYYVIDIEVRDIASYFKSLFFHSYEDLFIEINAYFKHKKLNIYGYQLLYARLLYPSFYFDIYEKVMEGKVEEDALLPIIEKIEDYEYFLKDIFQLISTYAPIEPIDWIVHKRES